MLETGFETRVKIQQIIENQFPEFILDESPKAVEFIKQYYISQEYQGGPIDITDNLDQYINLDNLTPEVIVGSTVLSSTISTSDSIINVSSTKGFPKKYGLLKIDDEIITYTDKTATSFIGCIRGFSGVTNYHQDLNSEDLVFTESDASSHSKTSKVENLSILFLKEFYKKIKYSLTPGLENIDFVSNLNVGNFIKEAKSLYKSKGTEESFRILFNVLFGESPKIINLEKFLIKPSSATYIRRGVVVAEAIYGDLSKLQGQTIFKSIDTNTSASISEVEIISRKGKVYYKLLLFIGYDSVSPTITGTFNITGSTKNIETVNIGDAVITVDSTIGFPDSGTLYCDDNIITYTDKSINQFFGCSGVKFKIEKASVIYSNETYYGYEDGDTNKKVEFRVTGVLSEYDSIETTRPISIGENISVKNIGETIKNPNTEKSYKQIFANSWIYNTSSRYQVKSFSTSQITLYSEIDKSSLKVGDYIDILDRDLQSIEQSNLEVTEINDKIITVNDSISLNSNLNYDIRRRIKKAQSSLTPLEYNSLFSDIQNFYNENDEYAYVASNSLPSYEITKSIFSYDALGVDDYDYTVGLYSTIILSGKISFITGSEIYYKPSLSSIQGLSEGVYYVEVISNNEYSPVYQTQISRVKLYVSKSIVGTVNYVSFGNLTSGNHNFTLNSQREKIISTQKILRKFPLTSQKNLQDYELTTPGSTGILINGVEILNYKSNDKIYYGPLESVNVLNSGSGYDVINPPLLEISSGEAVIQPIIKGSIEKVYIDPQDFDLNVVVSVALSGGNGSGASFKPVIQRRRREVEFDARLISEGGGVDNVYETITFLTNHSLTDGEAVLYRSANNDPLGIGTFQGSNYASGETLKNESEYYVKYISDKSIQLYPSISDYNSGINTIGFTTVGTSGIHKFVTAPKNTLSEIIVLDGGHNYTNRKLKISSSGISTENDVISFPNHGFETGELITYSTTGSSIIGLSTSNQYYIIKIDDNKFRLSNAGIGGTIQTNYERRSYVSFGSTGSGYHTFSYPEITLKVEYSAVGLGSTQFKGSVVATPIVRGKIVESYVYDGGSNYGSEILNYHKKPQISIKNGKNCQALPIITNGRISEVFIQNRGSEYYSTPDVIVSGDGVGAILRPVLNNNKIVDIVVINSGYGYSNEKTTIEVIPSGKNAILDPQVRSLTVNNNILYNDVNESLLSSTNEIVLSSYNNLQYTVCGYFDKLFTEFGDTESNHSPIIGWAYDGNPIYGSFGYSDPKDSSSVKRLKTGYTLTSISNRPNFPQGFFVEDYEFTNSGDLDECNGRFCITPEFPKGIYAYFATSIISNGKITGEFPYFIGNRYNSKFISENKYLNQSFDFNGSDLVRNTFPYKVNDDYAGNDFISESNEIINQTSIVESVTSGSIENFEIINPGIDYKVGDLLEFDNTSTGGGLVAQVSEITGKKITNIQTSSISYTNAVFTWDSGNKINIKVSPRHSLNNLDIIKVSGLSTSLSNLNGYHQIGIVTFSSSLIKDIPSYSLSGIVTDIYVSNIPQNISIGSSILIETETLSILNIFSEQNVIRVVRETTGTSHTSTTALHFIPDTFTIEKSVNYFDSKNNQTIYFNPIESVGVGTTAGIGVKLTPKIGIRTDITVYTQTQSIYIPNHPFETNQSVILSKPSSASAISVANTSGSSSFNLPISGDSQKIYIIKKSPNHIGIVTQVGLTTNTDGLFFISNGSNNYQYSLTTEFNQVKGNIEKSTTTVSLSTSHTLTFGDIINLSVKPNLSIGIGQSSAIKLVRDTNNYLLINSITFNSSSINTSTSTINLSSHNLKTGDKIKYTANVEATGLINNEFYYVYKIDENNIKLSETYIDSVKTIPPTTISITSGGGSSQSISLVNPEIPVIKNNNLVFDLSDSSLSGYQFKIFKDENFKNEFVSTGSTNQFSILGIGTVGVSTNATLTINYSQELPNKLFYALEKFGKIIEVDKDVVNYCRIDFVDSNYQGSYKISGIGTTTFDITLKNYPETLLYQKTDCDILEYTTNSNSEKGAISKVKIVSSGNNFKELPIFKKIKSSSGSGAFILPKSDKVGKINKIRILNEGFEYSSDKTLKPEASIPNLVSVKNFSTIEGIQVLNGGKNYISTPDLIIVNTETGEKIDSGLLTANLYGSSIGKVNIDIDPKGLPEFIVTIRSINNTNGISIQSVNSSSSGIVTCTLVTPITGFSVEPFEIGDKIYVEGIKNGEDGDGLNSENYGYNFFTVSNYINANTDLVRKLEFNLSGFTTNPGVADPVDNFYGKIINYKNYPQFLVSQSLSNFIVGESIQVYSQNSFKTVDLLIVEINENYLKTIGSYDLKSNQTIRGVESGSIATIVDNKKSFGKFKVDYTSIQDIGWFDQTGALNDDNQVIPDNDYYQNLSYSVKSSKEWNDIVSPVNNLLHPSGLKNFADTEITSNVGFGTSISSKEYTNSLLNIQTENRVDTINNLDLVFDIDTFNNSSKFIKFKNKKLIDYIECKTNRVLQIDDISDQFSSSDQNQNLSNTSKIVDIDSFKNYNRYLIQISDKEYTQFQLSEIIVLNDDSNIFTLEKGSISTGNSTEIGYTSNLIGDVYGKVNETGQYYVEFEPKDPYNTSYDIKYLNTAFLNYTTGIGTTSIGFINLTGVTSTVSSGSTTILTQINASNIEALHSSVHLINNETKEMNYVELFVDHDGTDTNIADIYFDSNDGLSSNFIGSFGASINGGILTLDYTNTSLNNISVRSRNIGFGTTSIGIGTYRFKQSAQIDGYENTVNYISSYSNVSAASTIISFDKNIFSSLKSTLKVSIGNTSALHQIMMIVDQNNSYTTQYPFISIGTTSGIGTFGSNVSGNTASLVFYPDSYFSGTFEILSFNEIFFKQNDYENIPPSLQYGNNLETVGVSEYYSVNDDDLNKLDFELRYQETPIFMKRFDPSNSTILNLSTGEFNIPNHFFSTGEELIYRPNSSFIGVDSISVGIGSTLNYVGVVTNILPQTVYAIKINNDKFKISTRKEYANAGIFVTFTSTGSGNIHELEMVKKNEKAIIAIDNIIQSPITYSLLNYSVNNGGSISDTSTIFGLSGISSIRLNDILKIDNEYMKVVNVGFGTTYSGPISFAGTFPLVSVERGFSGSASTTHSDLSTSTIYRGSFNIEKSTIYFTEPPKGSIEDQLIETNNNLPLPRSSFNGRVFLRQNYTSNQVYDNISEKFTGIDQTYTLTVGGANTVGLGTSGGNGIVLINGIYQTPTTDNNINNNFKIIENTSAGISSIVFSGITSSNGSVVISQSDVNMNELPRGGIIVSLGSTPGLGYAPLVGASVTAIVSGGVIVGIGTSGNWGSGYRGSVPVSIFESGHVGLAATITASVGLGGTLAFTIVNGGTGYINPTITVPSPSYSNLPVIGVSRLGIGTTTDCGIGLLLNVDVGASSTTGIGSTLFEVTNFKIVRSGYGFKPGDIIKPVGLVTASGLASPISEFELTVLDTFTDSFSCWQFGELDYIDSIKLFQNGTRKTFPLFYNSELLSFEKNSTDADSQLIDFNTLLLIFINSIPQKPGVSYEFNGGTSFTFTEAPKPEDKIDIYFYRGTRGIDTKIVQVYETIKPGDDVQIYSNNSNTNTITQNSRTVTNIPTSDKIETNLYKSQGIDEINEKPLYWTKQKVDKIVNGEIVSKSRDSIEAQVYPTSKIISNITSSNNEVFVDNVILFNYEGEGSVDFDAIIISGAADPVSAAVTAIVSAAGTIQSLSIVNPGSGYIGSSTVVSISAPASIGVGVGTTAKATISIVNGSLSTVTITNPGFGYTISNPPQVLIPLPDPIYENITNVTSIGGTYGNITGIGTTVGIGTDLAIKFTLQSTSGLVVGNPIYIYDTKVGTGVTSIKTNNLDIVGIGTTFLDNIYEVSAVSSGIITCNIHSNTNISGILTTGTVVGKFSWGKLSGFNRSSSPISIGVSGFTINSGLTTFPTIQRRGYGLRNIGSIKKTI